MADAKLMVAGDGYDKEASGVGTTDGDGRHMAF